jgi:uncharacterized integral membrane protein
VGAWRIILGAALLLLLLMMMMINIAWAKQSG